MNTKTDINIKRVTHARSVLCNKNIRVKAQWSEDLAYYIDISKKAALNIIERALDDGLKVTLTLMGENRCYIKIEE